MSRKDSLMKQIDEIAERVRFWHNAILTLLAGVAGMLFAISQEKVTVNLMIWFFVIIAVAILVFGIYRLERLNRERYDLIKELEKEP